MTHVIAGAAEAFFVATIGSASWAEAVAGYVVPALIGNIIGGVSLVAALNHAQVVAGEGGTDVQCGAPASRRLVRTRLACVRSW